MDERRVVPRWKIDQAARILVGRTLEFADGHIDDMSLKGLRLSLAKGLPQERVFRIAFSLTEGVPIGADVRVVWHQDTGERHVYGLAFEMIGDEGREKIYAYLNGRFSRQFMAKWWAGI